MVTESEALLRAAARVAGDETSARRQDAAAAEVFVIHVTIKGTGSWTLDSLGEVHNALPPEASRARLHLTYASDEVFLGLAHK